MSDKGVLGILPSPKIFLNALQSKIKLNFQKDRKTGMMNHNEIKQKQQLDIWNKNQIWNDANTNTVSDMIYWIENKII